MALVLGVMAVSIACLLVATAIAVALGRSEQRHGQAPGEVIGGGVWEGAVRVFRSEYLLFACLLMLLHNLAATFLYNGLAVLVDRSIAGFNERTVFFSYIDHAVQVIAFVLQFFVASRLVTWLGMPRTLVIVGAALFYLVTGLSWLALKALEAAPPDVAAEAMSGMNFTPESVHRC